MVLSVKRVLPEPDGRTQVIDFDGVAARTVAYLRPGQWETIEALPENEQQAALEAMLEANRSSPGP